ncbi:MAG: glycosyltransferase 87 family protein, partial [Nevskiales bacterium]
MRIKAIFATRAGYTATCLAVAIGTTLVYAFRRGQDANWDQRAYHLDIPFLLLQGSFWDSIAPSGIQSYLNPLILIPQYLLIRTLPPLAAVATIALAQAMAFVIAARICLRIAGPDPGEGGYAGAFLGFVLCLASPMALSEAGTTIVDLITAAPVLLAYLLLLTRDDKSAPRHACLAAGLLLGAAAGLKLTNTVFAIGAPAFFLAGPAPP